MHKYKVKFNHIIALSILVFASGHAQNTTLYSNQIIRHPDGILGRPNGQIIGSYASVSAGRGIEVTDRQILGIKMGLPAFKNLNLFGAYFGERSGPFFHNLEIGCTIYPGNPIDSLKPCNPDGIPLSPAISIAFIETIQDQNADNSRQGYNLEMLLPISPHITFGAGLKSFHKKPIYEAEKFSLLFKYYTAEYPPGQNYSNPDGVEGAATFSLKAGESGDGYFGQTELILPLEPSLTLIVYVKGEKISSPHIESKILGFRLKFYPGNQ